MLGNLFLLCSCLLIFNRNLLNRYDNVEVFDGRHDTDTLIGRYCGAKVTKNSLCRNKPLFCLVISPV